MLHGRPDRVTLTAALFPGQGSHTSGMRALVERERPDLLALACEAVGEDPFERVEEGTCFAQPAILCASLASWEHLGRPRVDAVAGHSLGEFAALVAAGALAEADAVRLVTLRGRLMDRAAASGGRTGGMLALLKAGAAQTAALAAEFGVTVANDNAPGQVVLSGEREALERLAEAAGRQGLRTMWLAVAGAFHSPLMAGAVPAFRAALDEVEFATPEVPVVCCLTARPFDDFRARLAEALTHPVRWRETLLALHASGVRRFLEAGPGKVLSGLVRRTLDGVETLTAASLEAAGA